MESSKLQPCLSYRDGRIKDLLDDGTLAPHDEVPGGVTDIHYTTGVRSEAINASTMEAVEIRYVRNWITSPVLRQKSLSDVDYYVDTGHKEQSVGYSVGSNA